MRALLWLGLLGLFGSACAASNTTGGPTPAPNGQPAPPSLAASPSAAANPAQPAVDAAIVDAAARLSLPSSAVTVERVEPRQWPDASWGCPQQGGVYAQVVTPGYVIVVSGAGQQLEYHADSRGRVILCNQ